MSNEQNDQQEKKTRAPMWHVASVGNGASETITVIEGPMLKSEADKKVRSLCKAEDTELGASFASIRFGLRGRRGTRTVKERVVSTNEREIPAFVAG